MESMGKKTPRPRRSFTPEFRAEIVELCRRGDRSVGQVAKDFDLTETAVRDGVKQAEVGAGERDGLTSSEREELAALRQENRRLREDVEVLKRATAFPLSLHPVGSRPPDRCGWSGGRSVLVTRKAWIRRNTARPGGTRGSERCSRRLIRASQPRTFVVQSCWSVPSRVNRFSHAFGPPTVR
ncbi:transposase [Streptomyces sp. PA03-1a]|nr:transposase [Streptomyces sp. PA03-1a]